MTAQQPKPDSKFDLSPHSLQSTQLVHARRYSSALINLLITLGATVLTLLLVEIGFRFLPDSPKPIASAARPYQYFLPEHNEGRHDYAHSPTKPAGNFRIIVIGDSFTYGDKMQFYDTFSKRLERMLNLNEQQRKVEVLNWGKPGYSTMHEIVQVRRAVTEYNPDLILLQVTLNDLDAVPYRVSHSYQNSQGQIILANPIFTYWKSLAFIARRILNTITHREYSQYYRDIFANPQNQSTFTAAVTEIAKSARNHNVPLVATLFPLFSHPLDADYPFNSQHDYIRSVFKQAQIPLYDLLPRYSGIPAHDLQVVPGADSHPNEIAHRIAAEGIYAFLLRQKLLPQDIVVKKVVDSKINSYKIPKRRKKVI